MKRTVVFLAAALTVSCTSVVNIEKEVTITTSQDLPQNIIMVVGDGMGPAFVTAYRYYADNPTTANIETTIFDDIVLGSSRTYPASVSGVVTDSAASATALATGYKTYNGAIGVDIDKQPLETVFQRARKMGFATGLAVTSTIVHATPASYMVANEQRKNYNDIADSFFDDRINGRFLADIMLGAGTEHFIRDDRDLVGEFIDSGYDFFTNYQDLNRMDTAKPVIGLFGETALPWALDDEDPHRLTTLTEHALRYLALRDNFFLLVEGSQIDWAGHANDIASAMAEMEDFAHTVELLKAFADDNPDTLVVITSDHSTGGLTVGGADGYRWEPQLLKSLKASVPTIANALVDQDDRLSYLESQLNIELTDEEQNLVSLINQNMSPRERENIIKRVLDMRTNTGWTTTGHTADDVLVFGFGPQSERFRGHLNNTDIANILFDILQEMEAVN